MGATYSGKHFSLLRYIINYSITAVKRFKAQSNVVLSNLANLLLFDFFWGALAPETFFKFDLITKMQSTFVTRLWKNGEQL